MAEERTMTLNELNSKIKEQSENPNAQKALLILKGGLKAYGKEEYTETEVKELVDVRYAAEEAATEKAADLNNDSLFEYCEKLGLSLKEAQDICFPTVSDSEEEVEEEVEKTETTDEAEQEEEKEEESSEEESTEETTEEETETEPETETEEEEEKAEESEEEKEEEKSES